MKPIAYICALSFNLLFSCVLFAKTKHNANTSKILKFYHTEEFLEDAMPCMERHLILLKNDLNLSAAQQNHVKSLIKRIYPAKNIYKLFEELFAANFSPKNVESKLNFTNTPLGIKLRQSYTLAATTPIATRQDFFNRNEKTLLTPSRRNALTTFITSSEQDKTYAALESRCYLALTLVRNAYVSAGKKISIKQLKDAANERETSYLEAAKKRYEIFNFFLLKDYEPKEIDLLTKYYSSAEGRQFTRAYKKTLYDTMESAANTLFDQISNPPKKK